MRNSFADEISKIADEDDRLVLLSGDIGNRLFDNFKAAHPDRFLNCGVAEANMTGVAAGLAMNGLRPITYTITPFATTRCLEQIRDDICYANLSVTIVGVGSGLGYAELGATHQSLEDVAFLRALPNMAVLCPADPLETRHALHAAFQRDGPTYIRLGKKGEPTVHSDLSDYCIGKALTLRDGNDVALLTTGTIAPLTLAVADALAQLGFDPLVLHFPSVKPLEDEALANCLRRYPVVATIEEHSRIGGFGAAIAEWASDYGSDLTALLRFGTQDVFLHEAGGTDYARTRHGLSVEPIVEAITREINNQKRSVG